MRSQADDFTGVQSGRGFRLRDFGSGDKSTASLERRSMHSRGSSRQILHLTPMQDYEARIEGGVETDSINRGPDLSDQSIRIGKTVEVRRQ